VLNARRAWGGLDSAIETDLTRLTACWREQDRLVERINANWVAQRAHEQVIGRGFEGAIAPGRRRDIVLALQRDRPGLLEHPPLVMPVLPPPVPTPAAIAAAERARQRDEQNAKQFRRGAFTGAPGVGGI
jgi:hypothetical protein